MTPVNKGSSVQRTHPLLYWMTIAYIVGLPNFLQFDTTGRTHEFGLFNVSSIGRIALTLSIAYLLAVNLALTRDPMFQRKIRMSLGVWVALLVWCTIATIFQPASRLSPSLPTDLPLSIFRLAEWVLAFALLLVLFTREPVERSMALIIEIVGRSSWITILMVWIAWQRVRSFSRWCVRKPWNSRVPGKLCLSVLHGLFQALLLSMGGMLLLYHHVGPDQSSYPHLRIRSRSRVLRTCVLQETRHSLGNCRPVSGAWSRHRDFRPYNSLCDTGC
jgi:hypothetical protein